MNYMFKSIAAKVISHFFCEYIDQVDSSQLELAIWEGKARLENVKIVKDALATHNLPFTVNNGSIGSISLLFPWSRLRSEPCVVNVEDVFMVASVSGNILISKDLETKRAVEKLHEEESTVSEGGTISSILSQVIDNIQFHIKNVHIRVELNVNDSIVAIGVTINSINSFSVNEALEYAFISLSSAILRKKIEVSDLSIYIDPNQEPVPSENFVDTMQKMIYTSHHYILRPFTFSGYVYIHRQSTTENPEEDTENSTELHVDTKGINLALDELQWRGLMELERQYAMFNTRRKYSHCGKPAKLPQSDRSSSKWWRYAHRCAVDKTNKYSFDVNNALNILVNRKKYVNLVESGDKEAVKKFEKNFDLPIVLFLRNYANAAKRSIEEGTRLSPEEIEAVMQEQKKLKSQTLNVVLKMGMLSISFLKKDLSPITHFLLTEIVTTYNKHKFNSQIELGIESMTMFNEMSDRFNKTLTSNGGVKVVFISKANKPNDINIQASGTTFVIDLQFLDQIVGFFKKERKFILFNEESNSNTNVNTEAKKQIQTVIDQYLGVNLNIDINDTTIILPYQECSDCPLLLLNCQKTNITSRPNKDLNMNDFTSLYDKYIIQFKDSMLYLDKKPLLFNKFDCSLDLLMAIVESNVFDAIKINCTFDQFLAHISTVQFLTISNIILYIIDSILLLFKTDSNSTNKTTTKTKNESKIQFNLLINKIDFSLCIFSGKLFEFLSNNFQLNCLISEFISVKAELKGFTGYEFITSSAKSDNFDDNKFSYVELLKLDFSDEEPNEASQNKPLNKINVDVNNIILYAKRKCLLYIIELFNDSDRFERIFDNNDTFDYSKIKHKTVETSDSVNVINVDVKNIRGYLSDDKKDIGEFILKEANVVANVDKSWATEVTINDCLLKDKEQFIEIMNLTSIKANPFLLQIQRTSQIITCLDFDYVNNIIEYASNITLPNDNDTDISSFSLMDLDLNVKAVIGSFHELRFNMNEINLKGKMPIQINFNLDSFNLDLDRISLVNVKTVSFSMNNEVIDQTLIDDTENFEKNKYYTQNFIETEKDLNLLKAVKFVICKYKANMSINSINLNVIPNIIYILPPLEKVSSFLKSKENKTSEFKLTKTVKTETRPKIEAIFVLAFEMSSFSFAFLEFGQNLLSLTLSQLSYKNHTVKIDSFSFLSEGNEPIALCKENFFSCSDNLNAFKIQNIDFILNYDKLLKLTKYFLQFSPLLAYTSLFSSSKKTAPKDDRKSGFSEIQADFNEFSFLIRDGDVNIRMTIGCHIRPNSFEINRLAVNFILGELVLPLLQPVSIKLDFDSKSTKLSFSPINLSIGFGDIQFLTQLTEKLLSLLNEDKKKSVEQPATEITAESNTNFVSLLPPNFEILPIRMNFGLCFNDRSPFITLRVDTSKVKFGQIFSFQLRLSIIFFNAETGNKDLILEPIKFDTMVAVTDKDKTIDIKSSPIILNVHVPFLKRLIYFNHRRKKELKLDYQSYKFVNKMQSPISLKVGQIVHKNIKPGESVPFSDVDDNTTIIVCYDAVHSEKFVLSQLFYPTALSLSCFVYRENNKIVISPPYFIKNSLEVPINIYSGNMKKMCQINPNENISLPITIDVEQGFFFVCGEINIQKAITKSESGILLSTFKSISLGSLMSSANSGSLESFISNKADEKVTPSLYQLGSWTSSQPTTYVVVDNTSDISNNNIVCHINQSLYRNFIGIIDIAPVLTFVNELPFDIDVKVPYCKFPLHIEVGSSVPCPMNTLNYNTEGIIVCSFSTKLHGVSPDTTLLYRENSKTEVILLNENDQGTLSLTAQAVVTPEIAKIYIYTPAILHNNCQFPLNVRRTSGTKPLVLNDYIYMGSNSFVNKSTLKVQIQCQQFNSDWQKEKIDCTAVGISSTVFLPTTNDSLFVPINVRIRRAQSPLNHTNMIDFSPSLIFVNETNHRFTLIPSTKDETFWLIVEPHSRIPIVYSTSTSQFFVQIDEVKIGIKIILASPTRSVFRFNSIFIEMETFIVSGSLSCHFRRARMPTPIVFSNLLKIPYSVYQIDSENPIVVDPNSTSPFAYDDPFGDNSVVIDFGKAKIRVKLSSNCEPTQIKDTGFYIEIKTAGKGHRMLAISDRNLGVNFDTTFHLSFLIKDLLVSLINQNMTELCLVSFHNFCFKTSNEGENSLYEVLLDSVQIDDQLNIAPFPTLLIGSSNEKAKFLHCSAICYREAPLFSSFKNLTFSMQKINIYADMAFISDMYGLYKEINDAIQKEFENEKKIENNNKPSKSNRAKRTQSSIVISNEEKNLDESKKTVGNLISFGSLIIHPFLATVTYRGMSGRPTIMPKLELPPALTIIPNITNANLSLKSFQVQNFLAPIAMLKENIFESYKNEIIMESWQIAGHSDIFFNVFGIAETFGNGFKSMFYDPIMADVESPEKLLMITKGGGQLIFGTLGSIIQGGEGFIKNISSFLSMIGEEDTTAASTDNTNLSAVDTFNEGITSLGNGLIDGISGLITKPVEGGKKDGLTGAVTGLAKGVIGAFAKPAAGILDMSAGIIGGIRKTISYNDDTVKRFRYPNSYPFSIVGGFNVEVSKVQAYVQKLNKKKKYYLMNLMAINFDKDYIYALFDQRLFFFNRTKNGFSYSSKTKVNKISDISQAGKKVKFQICGVTKPIIFECPNQETAEKFINVLNSLVTFASIFN
ncbi:hypothetical protein M9Y10_005661 [Tritrichomonas musculus]|uniref:Chorein N-terminal domain-containing protein n=1 Tax=Tritrichomonas musculus TaxID=1915356 RepID=A0ABR2JCA2_9EUKA